MGRITMDKAAAPKALKQQGPLVVEALEMAEIALCVLGESPLICNKMSEKAKRELLFPGIAKNRAAKRSNLKHNPLLEYRNSVHLDPSPTAETRIMMPAPSFKASASTAALEVPGATKASIGRLLRVSGYQIRVWGVPQMFMCGVRTAGIQKTPDIRTRAILPEWACLVRVVFPKNSLTPTSIANLFAAAGQIAGVGDFRQEKGKGSFGLFRLVNEDDPDFQRIIKTGGAAAQEAALKSPTCFDAETESLWTWFQEELGTRGMEAADE